MEKWISILLIFFLACSLVFGQTLHESVARDGDDPDGIGFLDIDWVTFDDASDIMRVNGSFRIDDDVIRWNDDAAESGADWWMEIGRLTTGMTDNLRFVFPATGGTNGQGFATDGGSGSDPTVVQILYEDFLTSVSLTTVDTGFTEGSVVFIEADGSLDEDNTNLFWHDTNNQLRLAAAGSLAGLLIGGDTQIFRSAANVLRTPDSFTIDGNIIVVDITMSGDLQVNGGNITSTSGAISFGNENLLTTGSIGGGAGTLTSLSVTDGNITNVTDIALDTISSDAGTFVNVVLGSDAGDDFTVDTDKFVVEGDTGSSGFGTTTPGIDVGGGTLDAGGKFIEVENTVGVAQVIIDGSFPILLVADRGGSVDDKIAQMTVDAGEIRFSSVNDDGTFRINPIITFDLGTGQVGIGTAAPDDPLHVLHTTEENIATFESGDGTARLLLKDSASTGVGYTFEVVGNTLALGPNDSTDLLFDANGDANFTHNLGVNNITPVANLHVKAANATFYLEEDVNHFLTVDVDVPDTLAVAIATDTSRHIVFGTKVNTSDAALDQENMRILATGFVGINDTTPDARLDVVDSSTTTYVAILENSSATDDKEILRLFYSGDSTITSADSWIDFENSDGVVGDIDLEVIYNNFTGAHAYYPGKKNFRQWKRGMLMRTTGKVLRPTTDTITAGLFMSTVMASVVPTTTEKDPAVLGIFAGRKKSDKWRDRRNGQDGKPEPFMKVNAVGDGRVLVSTIGGFPENGDLICSSKIQGLGMMQDDDLVHSYTVAKLTETVNWDRITETVTHRGVKYKIALVACVYRAGG